MLKPFGRSNQSVNDYVEGLDLELPDDLAALNPDLDEPQLPVPAVEVNEVNDDAAWALWDDSVAFQDSQFTDGLADERPVQTPPADPEVAVPFASVDKKSK